MQESANLFIKTITVEEQHLDDLDHVNNAIYVRWIQEIASEHWLSKHPQAHTKEAYWVVLEHNIQYKQQTYINDRLRVETFLEKPEGVKFPRVVSFYKGDQLVVKARTMWCWVDANNHRPKRIPEEMFKGFL